MSQAYRRRQLNGWDASMPRDEREWFRQRVRAIALRVEKLTPSRRQALSAYLGGTRLRIGTPYSKSPAPRQRVPVQSGPPPRRRWFLQGIGQLETPVL